MNKIIMMNTYFENDIDTDIDEVVWLDTELNMSLYDFLDIYCKKAEAFQVCTVTEQEYKCMINQIRSIGYLKERDVLEKQIEYSPYKFLMSFDNFTLYMADYSVPEKRGIYRVDNKGIHFERLGDLKDYKFSSSAMKIYTTECYDDVILHYNI